MFDFDCIYLHNGWLTGVKPKVYKDLLLTGYVDIDNWCSLLRESKKFPKSSTEMIFLPFERAENLILFCFPDLTQTQKSGDLQSLWSSPSWCPVGSPWALVFVSTVAFSTHETKKIYFSHSEWLVRVDVALGVVMSLAGGKGRSMTCGVRGVWAAGVVPSLLANGSFTAC